MFYRIWTSHLQTHFQLYVLSLQVRSPQSYLVFFESSRLPGPLSCEVVFRSLTPILIIFLALWSYYLKGKGKIYLCISFCKKILFNESMLIRGYDVMIQKGKGYTTWLPNLIFDYSTITQVFRKYAHCTGALLNTWEDQGGIFFHFIS